VRRVLLTVDPELPVPPLGYGGIERIADFLARELRSRGLIVGLVAVAESKAPVTQLFSWPAKSPRTISSHLRNLIALSRAVRDFQPDVVHSFSRLGYLLPLLPRSIPKIMSYQRYTGGKQIRIASALGGRSLAFAACSDFIAEMGRPWGGNWHVIHNFTDTGYFDFTREVTIDAPLLFLSRVERIKGVHIAIEIALAAKRRLVIAGNRLDTAEGRKYWETCVAPHLSNQLVTYVGEVDDSQKRDLLRSAAALLVPIEWNEPFGIVFVEALACGTPVISRARGALPEIVRHGIDGFLIEGLEDGRQAVERIGEISRASCRERAETLFSVAVAADNYLSLYQELISRIRR